MEEVAHATLNINIYNEIYNETRLQKSSSKSDLGNSSASRYTSLERDFCRFLLASTSELSKAYSFGLMGSSKDY